MKWVRYGLRETASKGRRECMDLCRIDVSEELGRYRPSETDARLLRSDRAWLERYVATERDGRYVAWLEVGRYVATEQVVCSVATWRLSLARARSLRSDRATFFGLFSDVSCFFRRALRKNKSFPKIYFRKNVDADFYGLSDIDSVVTDFDPNNHLANCFLKKKKS
ncbi:hypothetical protein DY000_02007730 [Brassica cretica]|uniref:Uncharacterized protein n=1 Tax=Brassica cretica TaxID=69181 RepID=A0ABQ7C5X9_BRACR|nr:hypothetical protein DY000_02007730 [Brassica cretica]